MCPFLRVIVGTWTISELSSYTESSKCSAIVPFLRKLKGKSIRKPNSGVIGIQRQNGSCQEERNGPSHPAACCHKGLTAEQSCSEQLGQKAASTSSCRGAEDLRTRDVQFLKPHQSPKSQSQASHPPCVSTERLQDEKHFSQFGPWG